MCGDPKSIPELMKHIQDEERERQERVRLAEYLRKSSPLAFDSKADPDVIDVTSLVEKKQAELLRERGVECHHVMNGSDSGQSDCEKHQAINDMLHAQAYEDGPTTDFEMNLQFFVGLGVGIAGMVVLWGLTSWLK